MTPSERDQQGRMLFYVWLRRVQRMVRPVLELEVAARWPGGVIPPLAGGTFFREMADRYDYPEYVFSLLGRRLGCWPWTAEQVVDAFALVSEPIEPEDLDEETAFIRCQAGGW